MDKISEKIIGGLRIDKNNCGLTSVDLTLLNAILSNCLSLDSAERYLERIEKIWTKIELLNDFWETQHDVTKF